MKGLKLIVINSLLLLCTAPVSAQDKGILLDEIIAVIGDEIVLKSDVDFRLTEMKAQGTEINKEIEGIVLEELLYQKLLINQAKVDSLEVSEDEVNQQLERRIDYYLSQFPSEKDFEKFYGKTISQIKEDFRQDVSDQILTQKMQAEITRNQRITPADIQEFYDSMPKDSLPLVGAEVQYSKIVMKPKVTEAKINETIANLNQYRKELIESPYKFGLYASLYSKDPGSANSQALGCYKRVEKGVMVPEFEQAVLTLEPGQISEPFETDFGWHIAKLEKKTGKYYDVCHILNHVEITEVEIQEAKYKLDTLRASILKHDTLTFSIAANLYSQDKDTRAAGGVVPNQFSGGTKHEISQLDPQITLALNQLKEGEISTPISMKDQSGSTEFIIYLLNKRYAAHAASIETDYALLKRMTESQAQNIALEKWIENKLLDTYCRLNDTIKDYNFRYNWLSAVN